jgi:hypothetical protein
MANSDNKYTPWAAIDFEPITETTWLRAIERELKGKNPDLLIHRIGENIAIRPFEMELPTGLHPLSLFSSTPAILESFWLDSDTPEALNKSILGSLEGGCEVLFFCASFDGIFSSQDLTDMLKGVVPEYIQIYFDANASNLFKDFSIKHPEARCSVWYDSLATKDAGAFDANSVFCVQSAEEGMATNLADLLAKANRTMEQITGQGLKPVDALARIHLQFAGSQHGFLETICTLRALHLLWFQFSKAWGGEALNPVIHYKTSPDSEPDNPHKRLIDLTLEFTTAYLGGASFIKADLPGFDSSAIARRMLRNIHHILRSESGFSRVNDLVFGSYSLENLTHQIAEVAWGKFQ